MLHSVNVMTEDGEYAHSIDASTFAGACESARALHTDAVHASQLRCPVLVTEDGRIARPGATVEDFHGEVWTVRGWDLPAHEGSTGRVNVSRPCEGCDGPGKHQYWCRGEDVRSFYPSVFELRWVGRELQRQRSSAK